MYALPWVDRLYPGHFRDVIFLAPDEGDAKACAGHEHRERLRHTIIESLDCYVVHGRRSGIAADCRIASGTNPVVEFMNLAPSTLDACPNAMCFARKPIFRRVNFLIAW
ncbi:hypothetical protein [Burkholderia sp. Bp9140]|nr:hypothetical protein [Burkholderia sp. Bp9140]